MIDTFFMAEMVWNDDSYSNGDIAKALRKENGMDVRAKDVKDLKRRIMVDMEEHGYDEFEACLMHVARFLGTYEELIAMAGGE